ncbi:MAG TPA: hypothetical protein VGB79_01830 [Allosphingosinicella sp.]|jgi:hypothetical protein
MGRRAVTDRLGFKEIDAAILRMGEMVDLDPVTMKAAFKARLLAAGVFTPEDFAATSGAEKVSPCPLPSDMTALETTIFDNWPQGRKVKSKPIRYAMTFKAWTCDARSVNFASRNALAFRGMADLVTADRLKSEAERLQSTKLLNPISASYAKFLVALADAYPAKGLFGMLKSKNPGTLYHDGQVVHVGLTNGAVTFTDLYLTTARMDLTDFRATDASGKPLTGNAKLQTRFSTSPVLHGWASQKTLAVDYV